jgi:hypothetical protein
MTFLGFELLPIRANMLGTLAFVGADTCDAPFGAGVGGPARTGNLLLYKSVRALRRDWLGVRDDSRNWRIREAA